MIKKWDVSPAPNDKNPGRHKLLIKGEMKDIFLIVKSLGSLCSRPEKTSGDFDFVIYLSKLEMGTMKKLKAVTAELSRPQLDVTPPRMSPPAMAPAPAPAPASEPFFSEPAPFEAPRPTIKTAPPAAPPAPAQQPPAFSPAPEEPPLFTPEPAPALKQPVAEPPVFSPPPAMAAPAAEPPLFSQPQAQASAPSQEQPPHVTNRRQAGFSVPSMNSRAKTDQQPAEQAPAPAPAPKVQKPATLSSRIKAKWSMELPLIPTYSFQTLIAGSHNRFAHAAAMAVVENPGVIYNPLLLFGGPGTGKTHFVNSITYGLSAAVGQSNIFVTDGIKLSKGIEMAVREGNIARLDELMAKVKVLIIDDVHLLMVSEANSKYLSKWLNDFVAQNKQIVLTSVFPPKSLSGLEDAVGFQFTQGWMVDLKMPGAQAYKAILNQLMQGLDVKIPEGEAQTVFTDHSMPFGDAMRSLENMKKLEKFVVNPMNSVSQSELLCMVLGIGEPPTPSSIDEDDARAAGSWQPSAQDSWFKWGIFYPKGMRREAQFALYSLHERAKELKMNTEWSQVFIEEYNSDELYGIPFKIGNFASERGVNGVVVLGPQPTSALGAQESEFRHITFKILDSFLIKGAWLPAERIKSKAAYAKMLMDLV
jgi:chromosomal replication initiator protein